ncbi:MAG: hypothetical protein WCR54_01000 [Clostridia bacterium]
MIFTKSKKYEDITSKLDKDNDAIAIIGCETCVRTAGSGGEAKLVSLAKQLKKDGYNVVEGFMIPSTCTPKTYFADVDSKVNTIVSLACSAGSSNMKRYFPTCKLVESIDDIGLMVTDSKKEIIKVSMPYADYKNEVNNEYDFYTGAKRDTNDTLTNMEVDK